MERCLIADNSATRNAGAVRALNNATIIGCTFRHNGASVARNVYSYVPGEPACYSEHPGAGCNMTQWQVDGAAQVCSGTAAGAGR